VISAAEPGMKPTINRIGRFGESLWANAAGKLASKRHATARPSRFAARIALFLLACRSALMFLGPPPVRAFPSVHLAVAIAHTSRLAPACSWVPLSFSGSKACYAFPPRDHIA